MIYVYGDVAQLARAPALQAGGQEFDSPHLHHPRKNSRQQHIEKYIDISNIKKGKLEELEAIRKVSVEKTEILRKCKP